MIILSYLKSTKCYGVMPTVGVGIKDTAGQSGQSLCVLLKIWCIISNTITVKTKGNIGTFETLY